MARSHILCISHIPNNFQFSESSAAYRHLSKSGLQTISAATAARIASSSIMQAGLSLLLRQVRCSSL
jgi:hypothetical protein